MDQIFHKKLKVDVIQSLGVNLLNNFVNDTQHNASSSTSQIPTKEFATFTITSNGHIKSEDSHDENATNDYSSDNSCEFQNEDANYDISSSFDDEKKYDSNSTLLGFNDISTYQL